MKAGDIVAQIDPAIYERAKGQAEAELASAQAAEEMAQLNYDRGEALVESKLISKSDFDQLRVNLRQAKAQVKTRQALLESAQVDLSRTTIHAPVDGVVITRKVEAGQTQLRSNESRRATAYLKEKLVAGAPNSPVVLRAATVKLGIADGSSVEVIEGLKENDEVVSGTVTGQAAAALRKPFSPFPGPPRR